MYGIYISKKLICKDNKKRRLVDTKVLGDVESTYAENTKKHYPVIIISFCKYRQQ